MVTARSGPVLGAASTSIVESPRPEDGFRLSHAASLVALQSQALWVRTSMPVRCPAGASMSGGDEIVYRHGAACWASSVC